MIRRKWRSGSEQSRVYSSLSEGGKARQRPRRKIAAPDRSPSVASSSSSSSSVKKRGPITSVRSSRSGELLGTGYVVDDARDDECLVSNCESNYATESSFRPFSNLLDADEDESEEEGSVQYIASHYHGKHGRGRRKSSPLASPRRQDQFRFLKVAHSSSSSSVGGFKDAASFSFDTDETHLEDASETSISTITSYGDDSSRLSNATGATAKKVRWVDEVEKQELAVVHTVACDGQYTCRVVILLLMNNGADSSNNFEFLHCEYRLDQRLRVADALSQITELVVGTPEHPSELAASRIGTEKKTKKMPSACPFRPFTALYHEGRELINVCSLQDFPLQDGQSILVAVRKGPDGRDLLLKQSALLLSDRRLNKEIRKARISGRSLQVLLSSDELRDKKERQPMALESDLEDVDISSEADEADLPVDSAFWNLSLDGIEDVDFGHSSFGTTEEEQSEWFDYDFFKGTDFFLQVEKKRNVTSV